jgi:hypothetical protein
MGIWDLEGKGWDLGIPSRIGPFPAGQDKTATTTIRTLRSTMNGPQCRSRRRRTERKTATKKEAIGCSHEVFRSDLHGLGLSGPVRPFLFRSAGHEEMPEQLSLLFPFFSFVNARCFKVTSKGAASSLWDRRGKKVVRVGLAWIEGRVGKEGEEKI